MTQSTTTATCRADGWTDQQYLQNLAEHYADSPVPEIRAHRERLLAIASYLASTAAQPPAGWVMVPESATTKIVCAIEQEIDAQLAASSMTGLMHRQDGAEVWREALKAVAAAPKE